MSPSPANFILSTYSLFVLFILSIFGKNVRKLLRKIVLAFSHYLFLTIRTLIDLDFERTVLEKLSFTGSSSDMTYNSCVRFSHHTVGHVGTEICGLSLL